MAGSGSRVGSNGVQDQTLLPTSKEGAGKVREGWRECFRDTQERGIFQSCNLVAACDVYKWEIRENSHPVSGLAACCASEESSSLISSAAMQCFSRSLLPHTIYGSF
ncbi:hypothetical protein MPTK1_6g05920 [Marchantia polymorpha subsp. ruderalis]|uniref:Uncharacterized protein n=2 Tax=Marchantia polymorpha TaxID=3197 RepID=A0AAF6BP01_MARPO|nr:hypothetical protein MARPO_0097s0052 [Marchantia polymorpha]BBN13735.1 hypothetical protein Mp_6g05920 [Marchantia polymorpha subsp. ruderalis]|eukprot:PTQ32577.1 hypothetical protein MARPO_0097s0052 [Marchantia polymorpha]